MTIVVAQDVERAHRYVRRADLAPDLVTVVTTDNSMPCRPLLPAGDVAWDPSWRRGKHAAQVAAAIANRETRRAD